MCSSHWIGSLLVLPISHRGERERVGREGEAERQGERERKRESRESPHWYRSMHAYEKCVPNNLKFERTSGQTWPSSSGTFYVEQCSVGWKICNPLFFSPSPFLVLTSTFSLLYPPENRPPNLFFFGSPPLEVERAERAERMKTIQTPDPLSKRTNRESSFKPSLCQLHLPSLPLREPNGWLCLFDRWKRVWERIERNGEWKGVRKRGTETLVSLFMRDVLTQ